MTVSAITRDSVLAAIRAGAHAVDDLASRFKVLSSSRFLADALKTLATEGLVFAEPDGRLFGPAVTVQPALIAARCGTCGLKRWDAPDLTPGENVCTCHNDFEEI